MVCVAWGEIPGVSEYFCACVRGGEGGGGGHPMSYLEDLAHDGVVPSLGLRERGKVVFVDKKRVILGVVLGHPDHALQLPHHLCQAHATHQPHGLPADEVIRLERRARQLFL